VESFAKSLGMHDVVKRIQPGEWYHPFRMLDKKS
jgi:hypothetical protein